MAAAGASRYNSFDTRSSNQSFQSDPSSSADLNPTHSSSLRRLIGGSASRRNQSPASSNQTSSRAIIVKPKSSSSADVVVAPKKKEQNLGAMVKKLIAAKPKSKGSGNLVIPADFIAEDMKKTARKGSNFAGGLHRKLFSNEKKVKEGGLALTEVKSNTRSLAMVLRSERELLSQNKEQQDHISQLNLLLQDKNTEVEKLKDLCLKQREEIKALKSAILFPDVMNSQLQELLDKQGSELKEAKELIPSLQKQVSSLTGQLQCLAEDLAEVKADKYSVRGCYDTHVSSPLTPEYDQEDAINSLEFSSGDHTTPGSPDDLFLKDFNPCLTPYYAKTKSKEFEAMGYDSPQNERFSGNNNKQVCREIGFGSRVRKLSKSSDCCQCSNSGSTSGRPSRRSNESKCTYGKQMNFELL